MGDGPASPPGAGASSPSLTSIGAVPWVPWNQSQGGKHAARPVDGSWEQAGSAIGGSGGEGPIASVNGFPWVAFTRGDGSTSGGPGSPGCCEQARVARLEPDFGPPLRAFPTPDAATLLSGIEDFGLPFPVSFEYGEERDAGATGATAKTPSDGDFVLGEARGLKASTLYWFRPFATAGTPLPLVRGSRDHFATPPASAAAGSSQGAPTPQAGLIAGKARLIVAIVRAPTRVRQGGRVRVRVLSTEPGAAELTVVRRGRVVRSIRRSIGRAGTFTLTWRARRAPRRYRLRVRVRASDGRTASDAVTLRVLRRRGAS